MTRDKKDVEASLIKKGFCNREGDHHYYIYFTINGLKSRVFNKTSHSMKEISEDLLSMMARQCKLTRKHFVDLIDCPLDHPSYENILSDQHLI